MSKITLLAAAITRAFPELVKDSPTNIEAYLTRVITDAVSLDEPDKPVPPCISPLAGWKGEFQDDYRRTFSKLTRQTIQDLNELKKAMAEFDTYRHVWAEISANNVPPGRGSDYHQRMEAMQGQAIREIIGAAARLDINLNNSPEKSLSSLA